MHSTRAWSPEPESCDPCRDCVNKLDGECPFPCIRRFNTFIAEVMIRSVIRAHRHPRSSTPMVALLPAEMHPDYVISEPVCPLPGRRGILISHSPSKMLIPAVPSFCDHIAERESVCLL